MAGTYLVLAFLNGTMLGAGTGRSVLAVRWQWRSSEIQPEPDL